MNLPIQYALMLLLREQKGYLVCKNPASSIPKDNPLMPLKTRPIRE